MQELTPAEYQVALSMLALPGATERERTRLAGLASSTYQVARRRILGEGWIREIVLPNPGPCGFGAVEFLLGRPTVSERRELEERWAADPECVLLWTGLHVVLGVFFRRGEEEDGVPPRDPSAFRVRVRSGEGSVPAYFDYSGLWARFGGSPRPATYPEGLQLRPERADARSLAAAERFLRSSSTADEDPAERARLLAGIPGTGRAQRAPALQARTVLAPSGVPALRGRRIAEVILVRGTRRPGRPGPDLLGRLTEECRVYPFLFAEASGDVLFAGLGQTDARQPGRVAVPAAARSVTSAVDDALERAEVIIEPGEAITERVRHRYPTPFPGRTSPR